MVLPESRYGYSRTRQRPRKKRVFALIAIVLAIGVVIVGIWRRETIVGWLTSADEPVQLPLSQIWDEQRYREVRDRSLSILDESPLDPEALVFNGFSNFYLSTEVYTLEEKLPYINLAIFSLRKALLVADRRRQASIEYVLGKAYHFKGRYYSDLAIDYLERSVDDGYVGEDTWEYLGLAYSNLGSYEQSAEYFKRAVDQDGTDLRYLALSQAYVNAGDTKNAESYLLRTINKTADRMVEQKSRYLLGKIYLDQDQLTKAEDQYRRIIEVNPRSADAHYYLGEIMLKYGKPIEARAEWREALIIDPSHYGARLRYYK